MKCTIMYQPGFDEVTPPDHTAIWRFMPFASFVSLLQEGRLFFPNLNQFIRDDPYEGIHSKNWEALFDQMYTVPDKQEDFMREIRAWVNISCWHMNSVESAAMWKLYSDSTGVAITSTVGDFKAALHQEPFGIFIAKVNYCSPEEIRSNDRWIKHIWKKRTSFEHEAELRAVCLHSEPPPANGRAMRVCVNTLIKGVVTSPVAPAYVGKAVRRLLSDFKIDAEVRESTLLKVI